MSSPSRRLGSVCVYCGSSRTADPRYIEAAAAMGVILARENLRLVYGGGGIGLMGACAKAAQSAGGQVLGVIPEFLTLIEKPLATVETVIVQSMHERKMMMFEAADAFAILPGGIGTLEEVIELLSWRRLSLHAKPIVFYNPDGFWQTLFALFDHFVAQNLVPPEFADTYRSVERIEDVLPTIRAMPTQAFMTTSDVEHLT